MPFTTPLALLGLLFIPAVVAMYLLKLRRDETIVPVDAAVDRGWWPMSRPTPRGRSCVEACCCCSSCCSWSSSRCSRRGRSSSGRPGWRATSCWSSIRRRAWPRRTSRRTGSTAAKAAAIEALRDLPTGGKVSVIAADRSARIVVNETTDLGRVRQALDGIAGDERARRPRRRAGARRQARGPLRRRADPRRHRRRARDTGRRRHGPGQGHGPAGRARAQEPGDRGAGRPDGAVGGHALRLRQRRQPRPRAGRAAARGVGRRRRSSRCATCCSMPRLARTSSSTTCPRDVGTLEVRLVGPDPTVDGRARTSWPSTTTPGRSSRPTGHG